MKTEKSLERIITKFGKPLKYWLVYFGRLGLRLLATAMVRV